MDFLTTATVVLTPVYVLILLNVLSGVNGYRQLGDFRVTWVVGMAMMELFILAVITYRSYTRLVDHSKRDVVWREKLISFARMKGATTVELEAADRQCRKKDHFFGKGPIMFLLLVVFGLEIFFALRCVQFSGDSWYMPVVGAGVADLMMLFLVMHAVLAYPYQHEQCQIRFTEVLEKALGDVGFRIMPMQPVIMRRRLRTYMILTLATCGAYLLVLLYSVFKTTNDHLRNQWVYENELLRAIRGEEDCFTDPIFAKSEGELDWKQASIKAAALTKEVRRINRMPPLLIIAELFILVLCANYMLKIIALEGDFTLNSVLYEMPSSISEIRRSALINMVLVPMDLFFLMLTIDSLLGIRSRKPTSWRKVARTCVTFILPLWMSEMLTEAGGIPHMFDFNVYVTTAVLYNLLLIMIMSISIKRFYTPVGRKRIRILTWLRFIFWGKLEESKSVRDLIPGMQRTQ